MPQPPIPIEFWPPRSIIKGLPHAAPRHSVWPLFDPASMPRPEVGSSMKGRASPAWLPVPLVAVLLAVLAGGPAARAEEPYGRFQFDPSYLEHWSFVTPVKAPLPQVAEPANVTNPIDAFVIARLAEAGLQPAPPADRATLLRRIYLDLIGLVPAPEEVAAFLADESPQAFAKVVDALLARPEYGERWARHWLDVVRFAESNGYERDGAKPSVWRYRDYVIDSLNNDKPFDQFLIEQLAGDEIENSTAEAQIATTFLRLGLWDDEPADPEVDRYDQLDDLVAATSATFMAQTLRCARCHDHKFEQFTQHDYTRLLATFEPLKRPQDGRTDLDRVVGALDEVAKHESAMKMVDEQVAQLRTKIDQSEWEIVRRLVDAGLLVAAEASAASGDAEPAEGTGFSPESVAALSTPPTDRTDQQKELAKKYRSRFRSRVLEVGTTDEQSLLKDLEKELAAVDANRPAAMPKAYIWFEEGPQAPATRVFKRGDPKSPIGEVESGFPAILVDAPPPPPEHTARSTGRRLRLAKWLTSPDHPLTARVIVNRIWQRHFGDGLVGTENDFGVMGELPTHPELLDWLAVDLVEGGWSLKKLHRLIVLSNTYQMAATNNERAAAKDPNCDLMWRFPPRRLEAEVVRDCILAASGRLNPKRGGPSFYPQISEAVMAGQSRPGTGWEKSDEQESARRTIYAFVKRTLLVPELEVLDFPDTNDSCEQRRVSTVAPQALTFLNGEFLRDHARYFADRLARERTFDADRVTLAFELLYSRQPTNAERQAVMAFLEDQRGRIAAEIAAQSATDQPTDEKPATAHTAQGNPQSGRAVDDSARRAWESLAVVLLNSNEFVYLQ